MTMRPFQSEAQKFLVYREGVAVNWDCTYLELSQATGIPVPRVEDICKAAKWNLRNQEELP